jgi:hypothetical protein
MTNLLNQNHMLYCLLYVCPLNHREAHEAETFPGIVRLYDRPDHSPAIYCH